MQPKSNLFSWLDPKNEKNEDFCTHLKMAVSLSPEQRSAIFASLASRLAAITPKESNELSEEVAKQTGLTIFEVGRTSDLAAFLIRLIEERDEIAQDSIEDWTEDLIALDVLEESDKQGAEDFFSRLRGDSAERYLSERTTQRYGAGVLPAVRGWSSTVELRGVFRKPYRLGDSVDEYTPELLRVVPIASFHVSLDSGHIAELAFQAQPEEIEHMIADLRATQKQAELLQERVKMDDTTGEPEVS